MGLLDGEPPTHMVELRPGYDRQQSQWSQRQTARLHTGGSMLISERLRSVRGRVSETLVTETQEVHSSQTIWEPISGASWASPALGWIVDALTSQGFTHG